MPLGIGDNVAFLYDRRGEQRLGQFEGVLELEWGRNLDDISQGRVLVSTDPPDCCVFLGEVRSVAHSLVIFRSGVRVWEGPVTRVIFGETTVEVQARDVLWWTTKRVHRGRFTDPTNAVSEARETIRQALLYDDPNIYAFVDARTTGAVNVVTAVNRADMTYYEGLQDIAAQGVSYTTVGRRTVLNAAIRPVGQTALLRSGQDITGDITVIEDGESLATRVVTVGGDTFGATTPEPRIVNYALNPSFESSQVWHTPADQFFSAQNISDPGWGTGHKVGIVVSDGYPQKMSKTWIDDSVTPPFHYNHDAAPEHPKGIDYGDPPVYPKRTDGETDDHYQDRVDAYSDANKAYHDGKKAQQATYNQQVEDYKRDYKTWQKNERIYDKGVRQYNADIQTFNQIELLVRYPHGVAVHPGELISVTMDVKASGDIPKSPIGLRMVARTANGDDWEDRAFEEGPPVSIRNGAVHTLFVSGTVPADVELIAIEMFRDTSKEVKWKSDLTAVEYDRMGLWRGRIETWFDGSTKDSTTPGSYTYDWYGAPDVGPSERWWGGGGPSTPFGTWGHWYTNDYYGLVEQLDDSDKKKRTELEAQSKATKAKIYPSPLVIDVPQNAPLNCDAPVDISELVAGVVVPVQTTATCRQVRSYTILNSVNVLEDSTGEHVTVTLVSGQTFEIDEDDAVGFGDVSVEAFDPPIVPVERMVLDGYQVPIQSDDGIGVEHGE